jgi:hypothetical protein
MSSVSGRLIDNVTSGMAAVLGSMSHQRARKIYKNFDDKYIKPLLVRDPKADPKIEETFLVNIANVCSRLPFLAESGSLYLAVEIRPSNLQVNHQIC